MGYDDLRRNSEGYLDPTAHDAITKADAEAKLAWERHRKLIGGLLRMCELSDFEVIERIVVRDKRTGKVWW